MRFLPYVERGEITLIGATTQNPSFEVIAPLLSRSMVVILQALDEQAMENILTRALTDAESGLGLNQVTLTAEARRTVDSIWKWRCSIHAHGLGICRRAGVG